VGHAVCIHERLASSRLRDLTARLRRQPSTRHLIVKAREPGHCTRSCRAADSAAPYTKCVLRSWRACPTPGANQTGGSKGLAHTFGGATRWSVWSALPGRHSPVSVLVSFASVHARPQGNRARPRCKVTDGADLPRTPIHRLGKRVGGNPSRVRISYPPPL
jgi:hypothetical protein